MAERGTFLKLLMNACRQRRYTIIFFILQVIITAVLLIQRRQCDLNKPEKYTKVNLWTMTTKPNSTGQSGYGWKTIAACSDPGLRILYMVHTNPEGIDKRLWLRNTIGDPHVQALVSSSIVFFAGASPDLELQWELQQEAYNEGDLVLLNLTETRRNLPHKFFLGARWILENCHLDSAVALVKLEEDVLVNVFVLSSYVSSSLMWLPGIHGLVRTNITAVRSRSSAWYVSRDEYAPDVFPDYCAGEAIIMKPTTLTRLVDAAVAVPYFWIGHIYSTGMVADFANVDLVDLSEHVIEKKPKKLTTVGDTTLFVYTRLARVSDDQKESLWEDILRSNQTAPRDFRKNVEVYYRSVG